MILATIFSGTIALLRAARLLFLVSLILGGVAWADPPSTDWVARYSGLGNGNNQLTDMAVDSRGCIYVTGYSSGSLWDMATVKYSPTGRQLWAARYNGSTGGDDVPYGIAIDSRGDVYVAGYSDGNGHFNYDFTTIKYDSTLVRQWVRTYSGQGNGGLDEAYAVAADVNGNAYVTGFSFEAATGNDYVTIKYDPTGTQQWVRRYDGPANSDDGANAITLDALGDVYVTGSSQRSPAGGNYDIATVKYNTLGVQQWVRTFNGAADANDGGIAVAVDSAQNIYVAGYSTGAGTRFDMTTIKYAADGQQVWLRTYDANHSFDSAHALVLDQNANVYVTGFATVSGSQSDYATIKYDTNGVQQWIETYDGPVSGYDEGQSVVVDQDANVYVTGYSDGGTSMVNYDYATVKYDPAGTQQWAVRYNGPGDNIDVGVRLILGGANDVIVGGWSTGTNGGLVDFTTIKYHQGGTADVAAEPGIGPSLWVTSAPNPFRDDANLRFHLPQRGPVDLTLWDASGRRVLTLAHGWMDAGDHQKELTGADLAPGVYLYRLNAGSGAASGKIIRR